MAAAFTLQQAAPAFDFSRQYLHQEQLYGLEGRPAAAAQPASKGDARFGGETEDDAPPHHGQQWVLLRFSQPIVAPAVRSRAASHLKLWWAAIRCQPACVSGVHSSVVTC